MTQPDKPDDQPKTPTQAPTVPSRHAPNGVPEGADTDAKGLPDTGRQESETAGQPT